MSRQSHRWKEKFCLQWDTADFFGGGCIHLVGLNLTVSTFILENIMYVQSQKELGHVEVAQELLCGNNRVVGCARVWNKSYETGDFLLGSGVREVLALV